MVPSGNKTKRLSSVNHTTKAIHHHHHHYHRTYQQRRQKAYPNLKLPRGRSCLRLEMAKLANKKNGYRSVIVITFIRHIFAIWWRFRHAIKMMADIEKMLNEDELFGNAGDTPKERVEQHRKRECLKGATNKG